MDRTVVDLLVEQGIVLRRHSYGQHKTTCPWCSEGRKKSSEPCLSVVIDEEGIAWNCKHCGERGGSFYREQELPEKKRVSREPAKKAYDTSAITHDREAISAGSKMEKYLAARGISLNTASQCGVTKSSWKFAGDEQASPCICFAYNDPYTGAPISLKFRSGRKQFGQLSNRPRIAYSPRILKPTRGSPLVITEGEIDALSVVEALPEYSVISMPDGATDKTMDWLGAIDFDQFGRVILAVDNDENGKGAEQELARRIGKAKCYRVRYPDGCKDSNDVLVKRGAEELKAVITRAEPYPIESLHGAVDFIDDAMRMFHGDFKKGLSTGWQNLDNNYLIRFPELCIVTGVPGSGKSNWLDALLVNLVKQHKMKFGLCSFENPPDEHLNKLAEIYIGKPTSNGPTPKMSEAELHEAYTWIANNFCFIRGDDEAKTIDWCLEAASAAVLRYGINGLLIDPYNEFEHQRNSRQSETEYVSDFLSKIKRWAAQHDCCVWLVAHPQKLRRAQDGSFPVPDLYDISGSAHFYNKTDVGIVIERDFTEGSRKVRVHIKKVRFKRSGRVGTQKFEYEPACGRYSIGYDQPRMGIDNDD